MISYLPFFFPFCYLLFFYHNVFMEEIEIYPEVVYPLSIYFASCIAAASVAHFLHFRQYQLKVVTNAIDTFIGCLLCWPVCFPYFLYNLKKVLAGTVKIEKREEISATQVAQAFVVMFILFFLTAIAVPSMVQSPRRANEANAVAALKSYAAAQIVYHEQFGSGYCDNFRNLFYTSDKNGKPLALISRRLADAFVAPAPGKPTAGDHALEPIPFRGYVFCEDPSIAQNDSWNESFALVAYPAIPGKTGHSMFWIGKKGNVYSCPLSYREQILRPITAEESPLHPAPTREWIYL